MDALSHALIASILFLAGGFMQLLPFAVLGAVIPDADIFFPVISDRNPSLYLFTHGGVAHSIAGALVLSVLGYGAIVLTAAAGIIPPGSVAGAGMYGFAAILAGALSHVAIDLLAYPGIPLLAPFTDRKYSLAILPGPSVLLAGAALGLAAVTVLRLLPLRYALALYAGTVLVYLAIRAVMFLIADAKLPGRKVPGINPLRWLVIREDEARYLVRYYTMFRGYSDESVFYKYRDTDAGEVTGFLRLPEIRRLFYYSYCVTAERIGSVLILADPLREKGFLWYPQKFRRVAMTVEDHP